MTAAAVPFYRGKAFRQRLRKVIAYVLLAVGFIWFSFPLLWMTLGSFKSFADLATIPPRIWPSSFHWENYPDAWTIVPFGRYFINTAIITGVNIIGILTSCSLVAYGFARQRFWGRNFFFGLMLSTMMLPSWVTLIPQFLIFHAIGWVNTWYPLTVPAFFATSASYIFLLRQFFLTLPLELDEAAKLDGCTRFGVYWRILMPLCGPILATIMIFTFISRWNDFFGPLIYIHRAELYTVSVGLAFLRNAVSLDTGEPVQALLLAASVFCSLPLLVIFFVGQKYFVRGIALTGRTGM